MNRNDDFLVERVGDGAIQGFMAQVYGWMTVGLLVTAVVAYGFLSTPELVYALLSNKILFFGLIAAELGLVVCLSWLLPRMSASIATASFMLYSVLSGITLTAILVMYTQTSIVSTLFVTAGMFAAMSIYGYTTKRDLTRLGSLMFMGLIGILLASVVNIFLGSPAVYWVITYIGVIVFVGLTAYDTQYLKNMGESLSEDDPENYRKFAIFGALKLYLDFINLFIMMLRLIGDRR